MSGYILQFDGTPVTVPSLIGPFESREAAFEWAVDYIGRSGWEAWDWSYSAVELTNPEDV